MSNPLLTPFKSSSYHPSSAFPRTRTRSNLQGVGICICGRKIEGRQGSTEEEGEQDDEEEERYCGIACARKDALSSLCANQSSSNPTSYAPPTPSFYNPSYNSRYATNNPTPYRAYGDAHLQPSEANQWQKTEMHEAFRTMQNESRESGAGSGMMGAQYGQGKPRRVEVGSEDERMMGWEDAFADASEGEEGMVPEGSYHDGSYPQNNVNYHHQTTNIAPNTWHTRNLSTTSTSTSATGFSFSRPPSLASSIMTYSTSFSSALSSSLSRNPSSSTSLSRNASSASNASCASVSSSSGQGRRIGYGHAGRSTRRGGTQTSGSGSGSGTWANSGGSYSGAIYESDEGGEEAMIDRFDPGLDMRNSLGMIEASRGGLMMPAQLYGEAGKKDASSGPLRVARHGNISSGPGYINRGESITKRGKKTASSPRMVAHARSGSSSSVGRRNEKRNKGGVPATPFSGMNADLTDVLEEIMSMERGYHVDSSEEENMVDLREEEMQDRNGRIVSRAASAAPLRPVRKTSLQSMAAQMGTTSSASSGPPRTPPLALEAGRRLSLIAPAAPLRAGHHASSSSIQAIPPGGSPSLPEPLTHARPLSSMFGHNPSRSESHMSLLAAIEGSAPGPSATAYEHALRVSEASARARPQTGMLTNNGEYSPGSAYMAGPMRSSSPIRRSLTFVIDPAEAFVSADSLGLTAEVEIRGDHAVDAGTPTKMDISTPSAQATGGRFFSLLSGSGQRRGIDRQAPASPTLALSQTGRERDSIRRFQFPVSADLTAQITPVKLRPQLLIVPPMAMLDRGAEDVITPTGPMPDVFAHQAPPPSLELSYLAVPQPLYGGLESSSSTFYPPTPYSTEGAPDPPAHHARSISIPARAPSSGVRLGALLGSGSGSQRSPRFDEPSIGDELDFDMTDESDCEGEHMPIEAIQPLRWTRGVFGPNRGDARFGSQYFGRS